jgi:cytochrome c553
MKYIFKPKPVLMASLLFALLGFSSLSHAVHLSGSCPLNHRHMGHGRGNPAEMGMGGGEIQQGEKLADAQCSNCHGTHGISTADDIPNLAGQEPLYLCAWMDKCRKQGVKCEAHEDIAAKLSDQDIIGLSEFYAHIHDHNGSPTDE